MNLLLFGKLKDIIHEIPEVKDGMTMHEWKKKLIALNPMLAEIPITVSINHSIVQNDGQLVKSDDEIAIMPPFSGG